MMVRGNDPVESFMNSVEFVKKTFSPLESDTRISAQNFDFSFPNFIFKSRSDSSTSQIPLAQFSLKESDGLGNKDGGVGQCTGTDTDDPRKGLSTEFPDRAKVFGANVRVGVVDRKVMSGGNCVDLLQFEVAWSPLFIGFVQAFLSPYLSRRKKAQKSCKEDDLSGPFHVSCDVKENGLNGRLVMSFCDEGLLIQREEMKHKVDLSMGLLFDNVIQKLDVHDKRLAGIVGKRADLNGFLGNMNFGRVGGGHPFCSIVGIVSAVKQSNVGDSNAGSQEENVGIALRVPPPVDISVGSFLKSALAGGIACATSTALMHPVDTIKTQVQASSLTSPDILSKLPALGMQGLYRGSIPAILGQFFSHGLRTGIFEASKLVLTNAAPTLPDLQVQSIASFCGTFLGTAVRIPCEVLKQRLQAGLFDNVGDAIIGTWHQDGLKGFFRGTGATLLREIPFYVAGMGLYAESKKVVQHLLRRELEPWETMVVGAVSGGFTAVLTTPIDVIKTRMMTTQGRNVPFLLIALSIFRGEGAIGLFRGAVPRFLWVSPLGALNFAGYELILKAMDGSKGSKDHRFCPKKKLGSSMK